MLTSFRIGAIFQIRDEATPTIARLATEMAKLAQSAATVRTELQTLSSVRIGSIANRVAALAGSMDKAAAAATTMSSATVQGTAAMDTGLTAALATARALTAQLVAAGRAGAGMRIGRGGGGGGGGPTPLPGIGGGGRGGGGHHRPGWLGGGGGTHISGPGMGIPGGSHVRFGGGMGMAGAGLLGYGAYEAAEMEDAVYQLIYHSGMEQNDENRLKFRKILQDSMASSGYGLHDISESAKQEIRMFQGTPGGGIDVLPEMLRAATTESRLKGESPEESMKALIGLAHMTKQYSPEAIQKLAPAFAFLSTANPGSLGSIERAAGYAVPLLQSGLEIDPMQSLLLGTALTRAGATSTKSGTWLREMALRAMPGTAGLMSKMAFKKHEEALKAMGLVDDNDKPTWFTNDKPDIFKMLDIAGAHAAAIPLDKRAAYERSLFGAQGGGGFALLADPAVREQVTNLRQEMDSPAFKNRYAAFTENYQAGSTVQLARTALADFNITMMELGKDILPPVSGALRDFKSAIEGVRSILPHADKSEAGIGTRLIEGAAAGALIGSFIPGVGTLAGAAGGGVLGIAYGFMEHEAAGGHKTAWARRQERMRRQGLLPADDVWGALPAALPGLTTTANAATAAPNTTVNANVTVKAETDDPHGLAQRILAEINKLISQGHLHNQGEGDSVASSPYVTGMGMP